MKTVCKNVLEYFENGLYLKECREDEVFKIHLGLERRTAFIRSQKFFSSIPGRCAFFFLQEEKSLKEGMGKALPPLLLLPSCVLPRSGSDVTRTLTWTPTQAANLTSPSEPLTACVSPLILNHVRFRLHLLIFQRTAWAVRALTKIKLTLKQKCHRYLVTKLMLIV